MTLSDTAHRILAEAARHPLRLATAPERLPVAAARAVLTSLLKQGLVEECAAPAEQAGLGWRQPDGTTIVVRITEAGLAAIGSTATAPQSGPLTATEAEESQEPPTAAEAAQAPAARPSLRDAAQRVLAAWDTPEQLGLADAIAALRSALPAATRRPQRQPSAPRQLRQGTKQETVLALLRRPEGATVAQIAEATGWQAHTVRGFFAGLKKRQGITVEAAERIRQVGSNKQGAKGSYTLYRIAEAG